MQQYGFIYISIYIQGQEIPLQARNDPEGSRRLRLPDFKKSAHEGGKVISSMNRPPLPSGNIPGTLLVEGESTPGP